MAGTLGDLHTRYIVPVDLNSFMYGNAVGLSELFSRIGMEERAAEYRATADQFREAVTAVLWHPDLGTWLDYDLLNNTPRRYFYVSNLTPLWTRCYDELQAPEVARATVRYLFNTGVLKYMGGTPTSLMMTGEQWDFPNCWSPLQGMLVQGLHNTGDAGAQRLALELARRWLAANFKGYNDHKQMFEKVGSGRSWRCWRCCGVVPGGARPLTVRVSASSTTWRWWAAAGVAASTRRKPASAGPTACASSCSTSTD